MADQTSRIRSKQLVLQLKSPGLCFQTLLIGLWVLAASICSVQTAICPSSVSPFLATTTEQGSFSGYTDTQNYGLAVGIVSNSFYYLYCLSTPFKSAVRKVDASGTQNWMASFAFYPTSKSLSVDAAEQSVYLASMTNPLVVLKLAASGGSIVSQHQL